MHPGATDQDINNSHAVETACRSPLDGFTDVLGPDGKHYLVPNFLKDPTTFGFHLQAAREEIKPDYAPDGVSGKDAFGCSAD
jgi:hypothetical protein